MNQSAKVTSVEAIRGFKHAMVTFEGDARSGITSLLLEVRRAMEWLETDRTRYWRAAYRRASDRLVEARQALESKQLTVDANDTPSCYEEQKAYEKARNRVRYVEEKIEVVKKWVLLARQEAEKFDVQLARMSNLLDSELPRAVASLDRMYKSLAKYIESTAQVDEVGVARAKPVGSPTPKPTDETGKDPGKE